MRLFSKKRKKYHLVPTKEPTGDSKWKKFNEKVRNRKNFILVVFFICLIALYAIFTPPPPQALSAIFTSPPPQASSTNHQLCVVEEIDALKKLEKQNTFEEDATNLENCKTNGVTLTGGFCISKEKPFAGGNQMWCETLASELSKIFENQTVISLGAGLGHYAKYFLEQDDHVPCHVYACDGAYGVDSATDGVVKFLDLTQENTLGVYDWALSLEVGEHIPKKFEDIVIKNIAKSARDGIVLSWAVKGQDGSHHVNNQNNDYIIAKMENVGWKFDADASERLRSLDTLSWFKNTIMVFRKRKEGSNPKSTLLKLM